MVWGCLGGRKDGKRTKVDPELVRNSQRTKTAAEGSRMLTSDGWDLRRRQGSQQVTGTRARQL